MHRHLLLLSPLSFVTRILLHLANCWICILKWPLVAFFLLFLTAYFHMSPQMHRHLLLLSPLSFVTRILVHLANCWICILKGPLVAFFWLFPTAYFHMSPQMHRHILLPSPVSFVTRILCWGQICILNIGIKARPRTTIFSFLVAGELITDCLVCTVHTLSSHPSTWFTCPMSSQAFGIQALKHQMVSAGQVTPWRSALLI